MCFSDLSRSAIRRGTFSSRKKRNNPFLADDFGRVAERGEHLSARQAVLVHHLIDSHPATHRANHQGHRHSGSLDDWFATENLGIAGDLVSQLGYTEASVSLARMVHLGRIPAADLPHHLGVLERYWDESIQKVALSEDVLRDARPLAQRFSLRTYDAIHLASAREAKRMLRDGFDGEVRFLAFGSGLTRAARTLGFTTP
jgi:predicted nucleic acid-binding protein